MSGPADTTEGRAFLYRRLTRRNRTVTVLRVAVPALGAVMVVLLGVQLVLVNVARDFTVGRIAIANNQIDVDAPTYAGRLSDGSTFRVTAQRAVADISAANLIGLTEARVVLERQDGVSVTSVAGFARFDADAQTVVVPGRTDIMQSDGTTATLTGLAADFLGQTATASGPVSIGLPGGATIEAQNMSYDAGLEVWRFERASVTLSATPGEKTQ